MSAKGESSFIRTMRELVQSNDKDDQRIVSIVERNSARTRAQVENAGAENEKLKQFLTLQQEVAERADEYFSKTQSASRSFVNLVKHPSGTGAQRLAHRMTFGLYNPQITPARLGQTLIDLFYSQIDYVGAVRTNLDLLRDRRSLMREIAVDAAEGIRKHSTEYEMQRRQYEGVNVLREAVVATIHGEEVDQETLQRHLQVCADAGVYQNDDLLLRLEAGEDISPDLPLIGVELEDAVARAHDGMMDEGLRAKGARTLMDGLTLQWEQYQATITAMTTQLAEEETDLRYTQHLAKNTLYLLKAQEVSGRALDALATYRDVMNMTQRFNSLGARVMLDRVGYLLATPFFNQEMLVQAREEIREAVGLYAKKEEEFHTGVEALCRELGIGAYLLPPNVGELSEVKV